MPDHSTFSKNRHERFRDSDLLRQLFDVSVQRCIDEGLAGGDGFAADASLIKADANKQRSAAASDEVGWQALPTTRRSVKEYLEVLDDAACLFRLCYQLIDLKHAVIVDIEASQAIRQAKVGAVRTMIDRVDERFGLYPEKLAADAAYGAAEMLSWLVHDKGIEPHIPVIDHSQRDDGTFSRADFIYEYDNDLYHCSRYSPKPEETGEGDADTAAENSLGTAEPKRYCRAPQIDRNADFFNDSAISGNRTAKVAIRPYATESGLPA